MSQPATVSKIVKGNALTREASFSPASADDKSRTIDVVWTTGARGKRADWFGDEWYEELDVSPGAVRLDRLNNGAPMLNTHGAWDLSDVLGVVESARLDNGKGVARVRFSERDDVTPIWNDVKAGILRNISVGYRVYKWQDVSASDDKLPIMRAVDWEPMEISLVPIGFDAGAQTRAQRDAAGAAQQFDMEVITRSIPGQKGSIKRMEGNENNGQGNPAPAPAPAPVADPAQTRAAAEAAVRLERERTIEIGALCRKHGIDGDQSAKFVADGLSLDQVRAAVLEHLAGRSAETPAGTRVRVAAGGQDEIVTRGEALEEAIMNRADPAQHKLTDKGRIFGGMQLRESARAFLEAQGVRTAGMSPSTLASEALKKRNMNSTSDFPNILANVAGKMLLASYEQLAAKQSFQPLVKKSYAPDFKTQSRVRLGEVPTLDKVVEGAEVTYGAMSETKESFALATYGKVFAITRETIINDDLGAFTSLPGRFGFAAARLESDIVWGILTANGAMGDAVALFHATHGNLASAGAIAVATIGAGRSAMRTQKGVNGKDALNIPVRYLIVPAALETVADQFVSTALLAQQSSNVNPFAGRLQVISEARLDAASASQWYLASSTADGVDMIELMFLEGQSGPTVQTEMGFDVNGIKVKALHDVAAKAIDYRGLYRNG
jgi:phage head maturation protease